MTKNGLHDCEPTLTDSQVLEFCTKGYLMLEGVVDEETNRKTIEYCAEDTFYEPTGILKHDWFVDGVFLNPQAAGAVRSLLGRDFHPPVLVHNHRETAPFSPAVWHIDGNYEHTHELNYLHAFYYPQETPLEMGPSQFLPGSHLVRNKASFMAHLGGIAGAVSMAAPAGSIVITAYQMWHRRGGASGKGVRNLMKYFYWRTTPPVRDWMIEPDFDFATADFRTPVYSLAEHFQDSAKAAKMFLWVCGMEDKFQNLGGQSWPLPGNRTDSPFGFPDGLPAPELPNPDKPKRPMSVG
jgi:hypothetical protein